MIHSYGKDIPYRIELLSPNKQCALGDFSCGNEYLDKYLKVDSIKDENVVTYLFTDDDNKKIMGYCSLTCSGIHYELEGVRQTLPAIEIKYFAIDSRYQKLRFDDIDDDGAHFYLSDKLLCDMIQICQTISCEVLGASYVVLYSVPDAVHFYKRNCFHSYNEYMKEDNIRLLDGCTAMYLEL